MILRKINAVLGLITTLLILDHAIFHAVWMLSGCSIEKSAGGMSMFMFVVMIVHAAVSIVLAVLGHKGAEKRKCNGYPKLNRATIIQRMSGVLLILLTVLHIAGAVGGLKLPKLVCAFLLPLFFTVVLTHVAVSVSKAFITLGIGNARTVKAIDIVMKAICALTLIADVIGFYLCIF